MMLHPFLQSLISKGWWCFLVTTTEYQIWEERAHHLIEYTWPRKTSVAIICQAFVMPLFKAEYDTDFLFYFVSLDGKNCLVDRGTKWYNISALLFACFKLPSCDSIYLLEVLLVYLNVSTDKVSDSSGNRTHHQRDPDLRSRGKSRTAWATPLVMDPPQKQDPWSQRRF